MPSSFFDVIEQIEGIIGITVHFIDKSKIGYDASPQTLNSFLVCASTPLEASMTMTAESAAISVRYVSSKEVLMTRCVQDVDTKTIIIKLQHGGSYRNTSFFSISIPV